MYFESRLSYIYIYKEKTIMEILKFSENFQSEEENVSGSVYSSFLNKIIKPIINN